MRPGWNLRDTNRLRVEFTADSHILEKYGIIRLEDYLRDCHFENIFLPGFQFKVFEGSNHLPKENDRYAQKGGHESFQQHLIETRKQRRPKNPNQYKVDALGFDELKKQVIQAIKSLIEIGVQTTEKYLHTQSAGQGRKEYDHKICTIFLYFCRT